MSKFSEKLSTTLHSHSNDKRAFIVSLHLVSEDPFRCEVIEVNEDNILVRNKDRVEYNVNLSNIVRWKDVTGKEGFSFGQAQEDSKKIQAA